MSRTVMPGHMLGAMLALKAAEMVKGDDVLLRPVKAPDPGNLPDAADVLSATDGLDIIRPAREYPDRRSAKSYGPKASRYDGATLRRLRAERGVGRPVKKGDAR